ncbi:hypothetical protein TCAL_08739 [Tigriopus californicus]|uniref:Uncharacterized protein n=1 Tax=Tigriopus californicus TaxID=6832 RepID=A0A553P5N0_TIGCA|nr:uncharacterized protein LOC131877625 isoform X2 [Tigriopus californicus]TRY72991.1 hypothetical protein TCAL_08739 [Tigriopus californicus]
MGLKQEAWEMWRAVPPAIESVSSSRSVSPSSPFDEAPDPPTSLLAAPVAGQPTLSLSLPILSPVKLNRPASWNPRAWADPEERGRDLAGAQPPPLRQPVTQVEDILSNKHLKNGKCETTPEKSFRCWGGIGDDEASSTVLMPDWNPTMSDQQLMTRSFDRDATPSATRATKMCHRTSHGIAGRQ